MGVIYFLSGLIIGWVSMFWVLEKTELKGLLKKIIEKLK